MRFSRPDRAAWFFTFRSTLACLLAFGIALALHLFSPQWAPITAWIVAQPSRGKTVSKGLYRFLGTVVGALGAIFLMAFFGDKPWLFMLLLAVWMGLTTMAANLVQYFRSYGAVLAGYTTSIVSLLVFSHPDHVQETATARIICILLGITVTVVVLAILTPAQSKAELFTYVRNILAATLDWTARVFVRDPLPELLDDEQKLITQIGAIEEMTTYAAAESMQVRRQRTGFHTLIAQGFAAISAIRAVGLGLRKDPALLAATAEERAEIARGFRRVAGEIRSGATGVSLSEIPLERFAADNPTVGDRVRNLVRVLEAYIEQARAVVSRKSTQGTAPKSFYLDVRHARLVGLRSAISVFLAGAIWILTDWSGGPLFIMMVAVNVGIFATSTDPKAGLTTTFKASFVAVIAACVTFTLLAQGPQTEWFLMLVLAVFLLPGGLLVAQPDLTTAGLLYGSNYLVFVSPAFPMPAFDWHRFLVIAAGFFASIVITRIFFEFIFPSNLRRRHEHMIDDLVRDVERIARAPSQLKAFEWETLMYNRVGRLIKILAERGEMTPARLEGTFAALDLGREIFRWQETSASDPADSAERRAILELTTILSDFADDPAGAAGKIRQLSVPASMQPSFLDIASTLEAHQEFLRRSSPRAGAL